MYEQTKCENKVSNIYERKHRVMIHDFGHANFYLIGYKEYYLGYESLMKYTCLRLSNLFLNYY